MTRRELVRRWWLLAACPVVALVSAAIYIQSVTPTYEVESIIALDISPGQQRRQRNQPEDSQLNDRSLARSWAGIPSSTSFLQVIARRRGSALTLEQMRERVRSYSVAGSDQISIAVRDSDKDRTTRSAAQVTDAMLKTIDRWPRHPATAKIVTAPATPRLPVDPDVPRALVLALVMGLTIGFIASYTRPREPR